MEAPARPVRPAVELEAVLALLNFARSTGRARLTRRMEARAAVLDRQLLVEEKGAALGGAFIAACSPSPPPHVPPAVREPRQRLSVVWR